MKNPHILRKKTVYVVLILLVVAVIILLSCIFKRGNDPQVILHPDLWDKTSPITFYDTGDLAMIQKQSADLDVEIQSNTGQMTVNQVMDKARLLDYLGKPGEAIKLYEEHFTDGINSKNSSYYHNIGRLYEKVGEYDLAIFRYQYIIHTYKRYSYYKDIAEAYQKAGNQKKYEEYMGLYTSKANDPIDTNALQLKTK
jgi:tetratricopeptide (TPR) repeat protein